MRTNVIRFNYKADTATVLRELLRLRDSTFDRIKVPMHHVRWVTLGPTSGYFTT